MKRTISTIICGVMILSCLVFATGCDRSTHDVDLSKYVQFYGYSTMATLNSIPDYEKCAEERDEVAEKRSEIKDDDSSKYKEYSEQIAELTDVKNALKKITFSLKKGEDGKIKNGDTVTVKVKYKESDLEKYGVKISSDEFTVKVSGLEEKKVIDPFDENKFVMKKSGLDGSGYVTGEYKSESGEPDVYYSFEPASDLKNGDKVTITASIYDSDAVLKDSSDDEGRKATKEITISGFGTIPETLDGVDTSDIDEMLLKKLENDTDVEKGDTLKGYDLNIADSDYRYAELKVTELGEYEKVNGIYGYKKYEEGDSECKYGVVYSREITVKVVDTNSLSKAKKGSTKKFTVYFGSYIGGGNLMVTEDNKLEKINDYSLYIATTSGKTYKDVKKTITYDVEYKYSEVK